MNDVKKMIDGLSNMLDGVSFMQEKDTTYLDKLLLDPNGKLLVKPYEELKDIPQEEISQFCVRHGFYSLPTMELIDFLFEEMGEDKSKVLEIGAGNGVYCRELGIRGVDNFMQLNPKIKDHYKTMRQAIVPYDHENIEKIDGLEAVKKYKPDVVIASWFTHKYNPQQHFRGGNQFGVDEAKMLKKIKKYIFIGNEKTHAMKPLLSKSHRTLKPEWLVSRGLDKNKNVIWIWE